MTVSEEMAAWAAANEEALKEYYQTQMRLCRDNRLADASLLDMNVVECYSGVITNVRYSEWLDKKNGAGAVDGADWEERFGDMDNVKIYLGESPYTESKVDEQNAKLKGAMNEKDSKYIFEINAVKVWLDEHNKTVDELTYEDYLNMDTNTKNRILVLLGKANS